MDTLPNGRQSGILIPIRQQCVILHCIPTHHPAYLGIGQHIYGITATIAAARHPANYGRYRTAQGANPFLILFGQQVGAFGRFFTIQCAG